jgi:ribulose-bisphosphate carboxylase large chain
MAKKKSASCDWQAPASKRGQKKSAAPLKTRMMKRGNNYTWSGVRTERYKCGDGTWSDVVRRTLVGDKGEKTRFHLRYFEVAPGGHTTLERHTHEHVVTGIRGKGVCTVKGRKYEINELDTIYIPPDAPHQLSNPHKEPFGFFCVVDARRDRPRPVK